ncbi:hypothetical protein [Halohasta litchfieldiae]|nr:hypothetical protein [Halohasta litchfieldiae]
MVDQSVQSTPCASLLGLQHPILATTVVITSAMRWERRRTKAIK